MNANRHTIATLAALCASFVFTPSVFAGAVVGATEFTQLLNNGLLADQHLTQLDTLRKQTQAVQNALEQYRLMQRNIESLPARDWDNAVSTLNQLQLLAQQAKGFAYATGNAADVFAAKHPTAEEMAKQGMTPQQYRTAVAGWSAEVDESIGVTSAQVAKHVAGFDATGNLIQQLKQDSISADGQKAAIQAGNQFAAVQAEQLLLLRQMTAAQMQQQQAVLAAEQSKARASQAAKEKALKKTKTYTTGREKSY